MGTLYIVPKPIGNLEDITMRALRILQEVTLIAAEDTRTSRVLLDHFEISTPTTSYHEHNKIGKLDQIFDALATGDVALISDAGTPGVSDPGYELVNGAIERGYRVEPLPGANAILPALVASGLPTDTFIFLGFLPKKEKARRDFFAELYNERRTLIAYENPYHLVETLHIIAQVLGDQRRVCVAREISKKFEEFYRGPAIQAYRHYKEESPRGEITLVISGVTTELREQWDVDEVGAALDALLAEGVSLNRASKAIARESGWKKRAVYAIGAEKVERAKENST